MVNIELNADRKEYLFELERRAVYSFLDTLYSKNDQEQTVRKSPPPRLSRRVNTASNYSSRQSSRASKRDLGEVLESLQRYK